MSQSAIPPADTPLDSIPVFDLATPGGLALLRRFDARFCRMDAARQEEALARLRCRMPLAERGAGLMVLPGGALALRREQGALIGDAASALALPAAPALALRQALARDAGGALHLRHDEAGLSCAAAPNWAPDWAPDWVSDGAPGGAQAAAWLPAPDPLRPFAPGAAAWRGPVLLRWTAGGAMAWEMVPAPDGLALCASVAGEALRPGAAPLPPLLWDAPDGDDRYQLLSSGLAAHLDEVLSQEVSDRLRYALIARWTDGADSLASRLADRLGTLPACFSRPCDRPPGWAALEPWPRALALALALAPAGAERVLLGIGAEVWGASWQPAARLGFLRAARELLPAETLLVEEGEALPPVSLGRLEADRRLRAARQPQALVLPAPDAPQALLFLGQRLSQAAGLPLQVAAPGWGLCHRFDPAGGAGNGGWYGFLPEDL